MQIELTYQMPYRRLGRLRWSMLRRANPIWSLLACLLLAGYVAAWAGVMLYIDTLNASMGGFGGWLALLAVAALFLTGVVLLRRFRIGRLEQRVNFNAAVSLTADDGGLRIAAAGIEYYLKWQGISQMLMEHDGIVVSCSGLFFLVPDVAFPDAGTRLAFIGEVYDHLSETARSISEKHIRRVLERGAP